VGALTLPTSGSIYLDANCVIYSYERVEPYRTLLQPMWDAADPQTYGIVTSELTLLEVLVKPFKTGNTRLEAGFRSLLYHSSTVRLLPISQAILEHAAQLRASTNLKTPDAIHAATALLAACALLTNDPTFRRMPGLNVIVLSDRAGPWPRSARCHVSAYCQSCCPGRATHVHDHPR